ncbi:MAG: HupE/UreJ family protein [Rhodobacteraceae bacterium]|nr:HupE/UreJ family protein [Paracoccaceae bacterium]
MIALSVAFLACELAKPQKIRDAVAERYPALVFFGFGLIHGPGFVGALHEIALPQGDVPLALLAFKLGAVLGLVLFIAVVLSVGALLRRPVPLVARHGAALTRAGVYAIRSAVAVWVIERSSGF